MPCTKRMRSCSAACLHRQLVTAYRDERSRLLDAAMEAGAGYARETADALAARPAPTFKEWLQWHANPAR